jgi:hypothetical protein
MTLAVAHLGKTGFGSTGFRGTSTYLESPDKNKSMMHTQSMSYKSKTIKYLDPSFISFVQRGKYIYFFRCGNYDPAAEDKLGTSENSLNITPDMREPVDV